jgi:ribosomal-protein-serine acetyltransferase
VIGSIHIRPYIEDDADALCEAVLESKVQLSPWLAWCHAQYSVEDSRSWISSRVKAFPAGHDYAFGIFDEANRLLGGCGLNKISEEERMANLGYWVRSSAICRGVASSAIRLLVEWAFMNTQLVRLEILVSTQNVPSQRAAEKAGAIREGVLRSRISRGGKSHDCVVYSFIRDDFKPASTNR